MFDFDTIDDTLIVGSAFDAEDVGLLVELGVGAVVSLQAESEDPIAELEAAGILWVRVCCEDFCAPTMVQIEEAVAATRRFVADGRRVYLHCFAGLQRSVTVAACYLLATDTKTWNARTALDLVKARRRNACPIPSQLDALLQYDRILRAARRDP